MNPLKRWMVALVFACSTCVSANALAAKPSRVTLEKSASGWSLRVNGQPFYVKGIACNERIGDHGEDFLKMVADTGANAVRIYGDVTPAYLDSAQRQGLKVNVGFWFNAIRLKSTESYRDAAHCQDLHRRAVAYVHAFKNHPAVLCWTLGNEVFRFTEKKEERDAFGQFLESLVQAIHHEDPDHPIVYASSYSRDLPELQRFVPDIDMVGVNVTGGAGSAIHWVEANHFDKPVLVTEFAPFGSWEQRKDANGLAYDPFDQFKADNYCSSWRQMQANPATCIGGFAFALGGFRNQDSLTWYNMNHEGLRRAGYWTIREIYSGQLPHFAYPKITALDVSPAVQIASGSRVTVHVQAASPAPDRLHYDYFVTNIASDPLMVEKPTFFPADVKSLTPGMATVQVPQGSGVYRVYAQVTDDHGSVAIADRSISVR